MNKASLNQCLAYIIPLSYHFVVAEDAFFDSNSILLLS